MNDARVMNLGRPLTHTARLYPEQAALIQGERQWSWAEIDHRVDAMVSARPILG